MKTKLTMLILITGFIYGQSQTWEWTMDNLSYGRTGVSATVMDDTVFWSGGQYGGGYDYSSTIDIYDIGEDEWSTFEPQTPGRWQTCALSTNGLVFIAGGNDFDPGGSWSAYTHIDVYSKESGEWSEDHLSEARNNIIGVACGNKLFFAGGLKVVEEEFVFFDLVDIYDTDSHTWSSDFLSVPRSLIGATTLGSKVFFAGGCTNTNPVQVSNVVDIYDIHTGEWTVEYLSEARASTAATAYGDKVYFAGGALSNNTSSTVIDIYNVSDSSWEDPINLSSPRIVTALNVKNALIFTGHVNYINLSLYKWVGENGIVEIYYPETGNWDLSQPELNPPRHFYGFAVCESKAFYGGGWPYSPTPIPLVNTLEYTPNEVLQNNLPEIAFRLYPNPVTSTMQLDYNLQHSGNVNLAIYNNIGEQVMVFANKYQQRGLQQVNIKLEELEPGIYFCVLKTNFGTQTQKLIKL